MLRIRHRMQFYEAVKAENYPEKKLSETAK
jgi:hypothetical protein